MKDQLNQHIGKWHSIIENSYLCTGIYQLIKITWHQNKRLREGPSLPDSLSEQMPTLKQKFTLSGLPSSEKALRSFTKLTWIRVQSLLTQLVYKRLHTSKANIAQFAIKMDLSGHSKLTWFTIKINYRDLNT